MKAFFFVFAILISASALANTKAKTSIIFLEESAELPLKANADLQLLFKVYQKQGSKKRWAITAYAVLADKPSWSAFRLSLTRALLVRDYLLARQVPLKDIILMPKGNVCSSPCQRVDVALR